MMINIRLRRWFVRGAFLMALASCGDGTMHTPTPGIYVYDARGANMSITQYHNVKVDGAQITINFDIQTIRYSKVDDGLRFVGTKTAGRDIAPADHLLYVPW